MGRRAKEPYGTSRALPGERSTPPDIRGEGGGTRGTHEITQTLSGRRTVPAGGDHSHRGVRRQRVRTTDVHAGRRRFGPCETLPRRRVPHRSARLAVHTDFIASCATCHRAALRRRPPTSAARAVTAALAHRDGPRECACACCGLRTATRVSRPAIRTISRRPRSDRHVSDLDGHRRSPARPRSRSMALAATDVHRRQRHVMTVTVPVGATTGPIAVTGPRGTARALAASRSRSRRSPPSPSSRRPPASAARSW